MQLRSTDEVLDGRVHDGAPLRTEKPRGVSKRGQRIRRHKAEQRIRGEPPGTGCRRVLRVQDVRFEHLASLLWRLVRCVPQHPYVWVVRVSVRARRDGATGDGTAPAPSRRPPLEPKNLALLVVLSRECMRIGGMHS